MYLCYIDESGTPELPGNTSHFVLAGISIPIEKWTVCEREINAVKVKYNLEHAEIHVGWLIRNYTEQNKITNFEQLSYAQRRIEVEQARKAELIRLQKVKNGHKAYKQVRKNYAKSKPFVHLTFDERRAFVKEIAKVIGGWGFARLFAECIDKVHFTPRRVTVEEQAFEQIVSRFQYYIEAVNARDHGLLVHDNNTTVAVKHTKMMKKFHRKGTFWNAIDNIIETPFFVDSSLTSMIQIADVCAYALRRYFENREEDLLSDIFERAERDPNNGRVKSVRHFAPANCMCKVCHAHKP